MNKNVDELAIRSIQREYIKQWLNGSEQGVLSLFVEDARIQPSSLCPIDGLKKISEFWFPKDGSITTIDHFDIQPLNIYIKGDTAISTSISILDWTYQKDTLKFRVSQKGIETAIYIKRNNNEWKIWRQMWSDLYSKKSPR